MEVTIKFQDGPIEAKITADQEEDFKDVLNSLENFVDNYEPTGKIESKSDRQSNNTISDKSEETASPGSKTSSPDPDTPLVSQTGVDKSELQRILKLGQTEGGEVKEFPEIIGNTDVLSDTISSRLLHGTAIILTVLDEYHGIGRVSTSGVKTALAESGLDESNWGNMTKMDEADVYFNRRGSGNSATIQIREPGKEDAIDQIRELAADLNEDPEE